MTTLYGIKNCDTCKKARQWLDQHGIKHRFHDYRLDGLPPELLQRFIDGLGWEKLLNTRGLMWKKLSDEERAAVDEKKALKLMARYPALIKRPVLDTGTRLLVGFTPETYTAELK